MKESNSVKRTREICTELRSLNDTNENKLTTAAVTLSKEHLDKLTDEKVLKEASIYHWFCK